MSRTFDPRLLSLALPGLILFAACGREGTRASSAPDARATGGLQVVGTAGDRPTFHDLGTLPYGATAEHVFRIRNDDPRPVRVIDLLASCGCAVPRISYRAADGTVVEGVPRGRGEVLTLPPGAVAELAVRIDTEHVEEANLDKLAQVRMRSDSQTTPYLTFEIHLVVERLMRAVPAAIELGQTPQSAGKSGRSDVVVAVPHCAARILGIDSVEGPFTATVDETEVAGIPTWILVATVNPSLPLGPVAGKVVLSVSLPDGTGVGRPFTVPVNAQIAPDVVLRPPVFLLGSFERGKTASVQAELIALVPGERFRIEKTSIEAQPEGVEESVFVEMAPIDPDDAGRAEKWTVVLRTAAELAEPAFGGTVIFAIDHPRVPELRAAFSGATR